MMDNITLSLKSYSFWNKLKKDKLAFASFLFLIFVLVISILGYILYPENEVSIDLLNINASPSLLHPLGTDMIGRDVVGKIVCGTKLSVSISSIAVVVQLIIGLALGVIAGYYGGIIDAVIMKVVDVLMSIPFFPLFILLSDILSDGKIYPEQRIYIIMVVIGLLSWPGLCRLVRDQILSLKNQEFMEAATALGLKDSKKMFVHLIPNTFPSVIVAATLNFSNAIIIESSLSFLGLGVPFSIYTWGNILHLVLDPSNIKTQMSSWITSAIFVFLTVMSINLFGDWLKEALNPKSPIHIKFRLTGLFRLRQHTMKDSNALDAK